MKVNNLLQTYKTLPSAKTFVYHFLGFHQILLTFGKLYIPELSLCETGCDQCKRWEEFLHAACLSFLCFFTHEDIKNMVRKCLKVGKNPVADGLELLCL